MKTVALNKPITAYNLKDYANKIASHSDQISGLTNYLEFYNIKPQTDFLGDMVLMRVPDKHAEMLISQFEYCRMFDFSKDGQDYKFDDDPCEFNNEDFYELEELDDELDELLSIFDIE
jgi:hypothetical protein